MKYTKQIGIEELELHKQLQRALSSYSEKNIHEDGSFSIKQINNPYFCINDAWNVNFLGNIPQFKKEKNLAKFSQKQIFFRFTSPTINLEVKYVCYRKLFQDEWSLNTIFNGYRSYMYKLATFINQKYPTLRSLLHLDMEKAEREWNFWLNNQGFKTKESFKNMFGDFIRTTSIANFFPVLHKYLCELTDTREEWEKDRWDIRMLHKKHGIKYVKSTGTYYIDFTKIDFTTIRSEIKRYIKQRLLSNNHFSWNTARDYLNYLPKFFCFIFSLEPTWTDLKMLQRYHIEKYIQWLYTYTQNRPPRKGANPQLYVGKGLSILGKFLEDIQRYEYHMAPNKHVKLLIFPEDRPKRIKNTSNQIKYIPDYVLEQLFTHINDLNPEVIPVILIAFKTGLRISDILGLKSDCLVQCNSKYSIVADISKTAVKGHRIPIDEELAQILAVLIQQSKQHSNQDNNPEGFIFIRYRGSRKGRPFFQQWIPRELNRLAQKHNITDEQGNLFHFQIHQFRHTYAIKMLNGGADILTVQELLAHASPEMTVRYAKLLDDTKRQAFEAVVNQGVFSFDLNGEVQEIKAGEDIPKDILQTLWQDQKLNAMDNPYGTCHARLKGNCPYMEAPPCLTCSEGSPCKDLAIG
ncbi:tyrosine-type recombinase/integrase, partial [Bacillus cereus]